jgi:hypothetical protein
MSETTCVSIVPKAKRIQLRQILANEETGAVRWRERRRLFVSEFYFTGPTREVMRAHSYISHWLATGRAPR